MKSGLKISILMAISVNGMVADQDDQVPWTEPIWSEYFKYVQSSGALVVGRRTLNLMASTNELDQLRTVKIAVLTRTAQPPRDNLIFLPTPTQIVGYFQGQGLNHIVVGGGPKTNSLFLKAGLVDELVLDIFPILLPSSGKLLFEVLSDIALPHYLEPTQTRDLGNGCFRSRYTFKK